MNLEQLKYPAGKFVKPESITKEIIDSAIFEIENFSEFCKKLKSKTLTKRIYN